METKNKISSVLEKAREYEKASYTEERKRQQPAFHACAPVGWINDPNGFSVFQGKYHLFFQYNPYDTVWGPMHWGHCASEDMISWNVLPAALAPDKDYDKNGCFSGSALEYQGKHILMYTGVQENVGKNGEKQIRQTQCMAWGDGENYEKFENNPVITGELLPEGSSLEDFRDPKIWREGEDFYAAVANRAKDKSGQILIYQSKDLKNWSFASILDKSENKLGRMWECPDFFFLDGKAALILSPQDMEAEGLEFHCGNGTACIIGNCREDRYELDREQVSAVDYGLDFYAPQTLEAPDGRRILIAWLQSWDNHMVPEDFSWSGIMSIPRELHIKGGRLFQTPVKELEDYRKNEVYIQKVKIEGDRSFEKIKGRQTDLEVEIFSGDYGSFTIFLARNEKYHTSVSYDPKREILTFDRTFSGCRRDKAHRREMKLENSHEHIKLRIIQDKYSVEIFANDGEKTMSSLIYTDQEAEEIVFRAEGACICDIRQYDIEV